MKRAKCYLIASVLIVLLSAPAMPRTDLGEGIQPLLIAQPHPELSRIDSLQVTIVPSGPTVEANDSLWEELRTKVKQKLDQAGLNTPDPTHIDRRAIPFETPLFNIHINMLKLEDARQYIFLVRTSLAREVHLGVRNCDSRRFEPGPMLMAEVWAKSGPMEVAASQHTLSRITQIVLEQTKAFVANWTAANPPDKKAESANNVGTTANRPIDRFADSTPAEHQYVASKNSKVFHSPDCRFAKRISPENLTGYKSRDEAVSAGKRPCKLCKP